LREVKKKKEERWKGTSYIPNENEKSECREQQCPGRGREKETTTFEQENCNDGMMIYSYVMLVVY